MADFRELIFAKAFKLIPGISYNQYLAGYYEGSEEDFTEQPLFYEFVLDETSSWEKFRDKTYPLFARYLKYKLKNPELPHNVIVSAFFKDQCYLLEGREFLNVLCEMEDLNAEALHLQVMQWLTAV